MHISYDDLESVCCHNGGMGCDLQIENQAVSSLDDGECLDDVACCEERCPLNSETNKVEKQNDQPTGDKSKPANITPFCFECLHFNAMCSGTHEGCGFYEKSA